MTKPFIFYVNSVCDNDISSVDKRQRNPKTARQILGSYARNISTIAKECKLGSREIEEGAAHLLELKRLIQEHNKTERQVPLREPDLLIVFVLSESSARKLKRNGANILGGRALKNVLFPLVSKEIDNFDVMRAVHNGMIPRHYLASNSNVLWRRMQAYITVYL